jgi:hypothetical protein
LASVLFLVFLFFSVSLVFSFFFMFCWHSQHYGWVESFCCSKVLWQKLGTVVNSWPPPTAGSWWRQWQYYWSLPYMLLSKFTYWTCGWKIRVTVVIVQPVPQVFLCFERQCLVPFLFAKNVGRFEMSRSLSLAHLWIYIQVDLNYQNEEVLNAYEYILILLVDNTFWLRY